MTTLKKETPPTLVVGTKKVDNNVVINGDGSSLSLMAYLVSE
jgi:hypothetical protein